MLSEVSQLIVRRDVGEKSKEDTEKKNGLPVVNSNHKTMSGNYVKEHHDQSAKRKDSLRLLQKQSLNIQAHKHHAKVDKDKRKDYNLSKENLVKELIGAESKAKKDLGVPEKAYRELVEFIASSEPPTIETSSKKSDIARPSLAAQAHHKKLTKKHKRILAILAKMAPNALRKYFHRKGLDKYWKVMDNIRKTNAVKQNEKGEMKIHKDAKIVEQDKVFDAPKKAKSSSTEAKHSEKDALLKKHINPHKKDSKKAVSHGKTVKEKITTKIFKHGDMPSTYKEKGVIIKSEGRKIPKTQIKTVKHQPVHHKETKHLKTTNKPQLKEIPKTTHNEKKDNQTVTVEQTRKEIPKATHNEKKDNQTVTVEQTRKEIPEAHKDERKNVFKAIKNEEEKENSKITSAKSSQATQEVTSHKKDPLSENTRQKLENSEVTDESKQETKEKNLKSVHFKESSPLRSVNDKSNNIKIIAQGRKTVKDTISLTNSTANLNKTAKLMKPNEDSNTKANQSKQQEQHVTSQHQMKPKTVTSHDKVTDKDSSKVHKENPKVHAVAAHHVINTTHAQQLEVKQGEIPGDSSQIAHGNLGSDKIEDLKEKISKTNNLKFKVAQALLAHCETQNRLRQVFDDVNSSLKKAAALAKAIGAKFGIKESDIDKITSEHTEGAVQQFLNQLF